AFPDHTFESNLTTAGAEFQCSWRGLVPVIHAAYHHESLGDTRSATLRLASVATGVAMASEAITVPAANADFGSAGVEVQKAWAKGLWHLGYNIEFGRHDDVSHSVTGGVAFGF